MQIEMNSNSGSAADGLQFMIDTSEVSSDNMAANEVGKGPGSDGSKGFMKDSSEKEDNYFKIKTHAI